MPDAVAQMGWPQAFHDVGIGLCVALAVWAVCWFLVRIST